jgi:cytidylate kinase
MLYAGDLATRFAASQENRHLACSMAAMSTSAITIARTEGAGGPEIARLVAEQLAFRYVDDGIIIAAANAEGLYPEAVALVESRGVGRKIEVDFNRFEQTEKVRELIRNAIRATADEGKVVIVAHAASFALAGREDVLRVLVTASVEVRLHRLATVESLDAKSADKFIRDSDKAREEYLKRFYGVGTELPTDYDLVLNTDRLATEHAAAAIVHAAR